MGNLIYTMNLKWFCLYVYLLINSLALVYGDVCSSAAPGTLAPNAFPDPGLPSLQQGFQVDVEANILDKSRTVSATVYFDYAGNRALVKLFDNGQDGSVIFNYATNEVFNIKTDVNCTVSQLSGSMNAQWFGLVQNNGLPHIARVQSVLRFGTNYNEVYLGNTTVRGIPVYHWRSCLNTTMAVDYYFSRQGNWSTATTMPSVPVLATVFGEMKFANGSTYLYNHTYEFFNYIPTEDFDDSLFQTPTNLVCPGRKNVKPLPKLPGRFYYRTEIIYTDLEAITFADTWYDGQFKLFRRDYRSLVAQYPDYTTHPLTEIHDYNTGVRYVIDRAYGNCTTVALSGELPDSERNITATQLNGSFVLNMKNPLQLFNLGYNFTYIGQNTVRGIICDTYIGEAHNFTVPGFIRNSHTAYITFYFISQGWTDIGDDEQGVTETAVPAKMEIYSLDLGFTATFNFVDFDPEPATLNVFDPSACFLEANKVTFQVKFPGIFTQTIGPSLKSWSQLALAEKMGVAVLRISNVQLTYDDANVFITATLLDKTVSTAQFTHISGKVMEYSTDAIIYASSGPIQCASFCVNNDGFQCNSFDYCVNDKSCHLSKLHSDDGQRMLSNRTCDHFSRTVKGIPPEKTIADAYTSLRAHVYNGSLVLSNIGNKVFKAVDVVVIFGWVNPSVQPPKLSDQFSYKLEVTVPSTKHAYSSRVWYDSYFQLVRYDSHVDVPIYPSYTTNPIIVIEDFHTGIKYVMDKMLLNCSAVELNTQDYDVMKINTTAGHDLTMKDPLASFRINKYYTFVGQETIRGMTCNIFEAVIPDYLFYNQTVSAVFRYAFLAYAWVETSDGYLGGDSGQPVRLDVTIPKLSFYMQFNIFDYDTDHPDLSVFDIHRCFTPKQTTELEIVFPGTYFTSMNTSSNIFMIEAIDKLQNLTGAARLRFQQMRLDYDDANVYLYVTLVEQTNTFLYFTEVPNSPVPQHVDKVLSMVGAGVKQCLDACLDSTDFRCNSFYFCTDSYQCLLSKGPVPDGHGAVDAKACVSYSRTVNETGLDPTNMIAIWKLTNAIYAGKLVIEIPVPNSDKNNNFKASYVNKVSTSRRYHNKQDNHLTNFEVVAEQSCLKGFDDLILNSLAVDECAAACVTNTNVHCRGFIYRQQLTDRGYFLTCYLSKVNPATINNTMFTSDTTCTVYSRHFLDDYIASTGVVPQGATSNMRVVDSSEDCAKSCSQTNNMSCKMFQYCSDKRQCLIFNDRTFSMATNNSVGPTCYMYTSQYFTDFVSVNAGVFTFSGSVLTSIGLSLTDCPAYCVQQLGNKCTGYYYSRYSETCYLTGENPGTGNVTVSETGNMCDQFTRKYFPPQSAPAVPGASSSPQPQKPTTTTTINTPPSHMPTTPTSTAPSTPRPSTAAALPQTTCPPVQPAASTTQYNIPTPALQQENKNNKSSDTGMLVGIPFGTFVLGLVLGVIMLHFYRRYQNLDKDLKTNFIEHEEM